MKLRLYLKTNELSGMTNQKKALQLEVLFFDLNFYGNPTHHK